jgi:hypothetical protein
LLDPFLVGTAVLLSLTATITSFYYSRIRRASQAYVEAKNAFGDVVVSFDKQLQRQEEHLGSVSQRVEVTAAKSDKMSSRLGEQESQFEARVAAWTTKALATLNLEDLKREMQNVKEKVQELSRAQEEWKQRAVTVSEAQIETAFPIKRERALAPLTETELRVLEFVAAQGERTAPEIKEVLKLTREHTARLMKKLYEEGYLERRSEKAPYVYRVKEEMLRILKKSEPTGA